jgi:hypothetical protein
MASSSVFIFELNNLKNLEKEIFECINKLKVNFNRPLPWEGFIIDKATNKVKYEKDDFGSYRFIFAIEEENEFLSLNGKKYKKRNKYFISIWFDPASKLMLMFTSNPGLAHKVVNNMIKVRGNNLVFTPLKLEINFLKWLEELKDYYDGILKEIHGMRATNLSEIDGIADEVSLSTSSKLNKCQIYSPIKGKGSRKYLKGLFKIGEFEVNATFYSFGKITISKRKSKGITFDEAKHASKDIYFELKRLNKKWKEQMNITS